MYKVKLSKDYEDYKIMAHTKEKEIIFVLDSLGKQRSRSKLVKMIESLNPPKDFTSPPYVVGNTILIETEEIELNRRYVGNIIET